MVVYRLVSSGHPRSCTFSAAPGVEACTRNTYVQVTLMCCVFVNVLMKRIKHRYYYQTFPLNAGY